MKKYILQCEDSPQGIFSAVYSAWELKYGHENTAIQAINDESHVNLELFAEYIRLETVQEKAQKVMHTIRTRFSEEILEQLYLVACSDGEDKADVVYHYIRLLLSMGVQAGRHLTNPYIVRAMELGRATGNERHHYLGFLRFMETPQGILLGRFQPKNNITELMMPHFADRFPEERFVIWDTKRNLAGVHLHGSDYVMLLLTPEQAEKLEVYKEQKETMEELWCTFVESISIKARENKELQRNNLPLRFRTYMPEFQEQEVKQHGEEQLGGEQHRTEQCLSDTRSVV
ncbi:MAG: TIGR03915 family putative DNA repair protein [Lachnospiraceae bacterium]